MEKLSKRARILIALTVLLVFATAGFMFFQSTGQPGQPIPVTAQMVGGSDGTNLRAVKVASDGTVSVSSTGGTGTGASATQVQGTAAAGAAPVGNPIQNGMSDGTNMQVMVSQSSTNANLSGTSGSILKGMQVTTGPAAWTVATQAASASACVSQLAAQAATRHCATGVEACLVATAAQTQLFVNLRDGATGAGTVKWNGMLAGTAGLGACTTHEFVGGPICGTINTAMTLELSGATAATNGCATTVKGYDIQ